jgi:hypothetical protein
MKKIDRDEAVDIVVDLGILLDLFDKSGQWMTPEARDKCYSLVYEHYDVEEIKNIKYPNI